MLATMSTGVRRDFTPNGCGTPVLRRDGDKATMASAVAFVLRYFDSVVSRSRHAQSHSG